MVSKHGWRFAKRSLPIPIFLKGCHDPQQIRVLTRTTTGEKGDFCLDEHWGYKAEKEMRRRVFPWSYLLCAPTSFAISSSSWWLEPWRNNRLFRSPGFKGDSPRVSSSRLTRRRLDGGTKPEAGPPCAIDESAAKSFGATNEADSLNTHITTNKTQQRPSPSTNAPAAKPSGETSRTEPDANDTQGEPVRKKRRQAELKKLCKQKKRKEHRENGVSIITNESALLDSNHAGRRIIKLDLFPEITKEINLKMEKKSQEKTEQENEDALKQVESDFSSCDHGCLKISTAIKQKCQIICVVKFMKLAKILHQYRNEQAIKTNQELYDKLVVDSERAGSILWEQFSTLGNVAADKTRKHMKELGSKDLEPPLSFAIVIPTFKSTGKIALESEGYRVDNGQFVFPDIKQLSSFLPIPISVLIFRAQQYAHGTLKSTQFGDSSRLSICIQPPIQLDKPSDISPSGEEKPGN
ncbi:hypothetical protein PSHT_00714, partial [Puccinia striiformis]